MFTINNEFKSYLKKEGLSGLSEDDDDSNLYLELKKAFFAGFDMVLDGPRRANLSMEEARNTLRKCREEFTLFWKEISSNKK